MMSLYGFYYNSGVGKGQRINEVELNCDTAVMKKRAKDDVVLCMNIKQAAMKNE